LCLSDEPDVVEVSRQSIPGDIDCEVRAVGEAWKSLHERGLLEPIPDQDPGSDRIKVKLVCQGMNESRSPAPFQDVEFGIGIEVPRKPFQHIGIMPDLGEEEHLALYDWTRQAQGNEDELTRRLQASLDPMGGQVMNALVNPVNVILYVRLPAEVDREDAKDVLEGAIRRLLREHSP